MRSEPNILAIETSTESCSVALSIGDVVYVRQRIAPKEHNNLLLPMVQSLLNEGNITLEVLNAVAVSLGPGSFVGTRLGVSVAQSLAYAANIPLIGFSTLEVLSLSIATEQKHTGVIIPVLDAQLGGLYYANFSESEALHLATGSEFLDYIQSMNMNKILISGPSLPKCIELSSNAQFRWIEGVYPNASDLLTLAQTAWKAGQTGQNPLEIEPIYLRHQVATPILDKIS